MKHDIPILLVEDDSLDVKNVVRAFRANHITNELRVVGDGELALAYLRGEAPFDGEGAAPRPGIVLLDLNMPKLSGLEVLDIMKRDANLRSIPVVVMTTSNEEVDRLRAYDLGSAGFIVKPIVFAEFLEAVRRFDLYWSLCELPHGPST